MKAPSHRLRPRRDLRATRSSRLPWLAGGFLVLLLVLLALLQLRWLGEVAQADRQRLDAGVHAALYGLRIDFDREISRTWLAFRQPPDRSPAEESPFTPDEVVDLWRHWRETTPAPGLVGGLWLVTEGGAAPDLYWDGRTWRRGEAPLTSAQRSLVTRDLTWDRRWGRGRRGDRPPRERSPGGLPFLHAELPGLVVPVEPMEPDASHPAATGTRLDGTAEPDGATGPGGPALAARPGGPAKGATGGEAAADRAAADLQDDRSRRGVVVLFDQAFLAGDLLPSLVDRYLQPVLGPGTRVRVVARREDGAVGAVLFALGPAGPAGAARTPGEKTAAEGATAKDQGTEAAGDSAEFPWQAPLFGLLPPDDLLRLGRATGALEAPPGDGATAGAPEGTTTPGAAAGAEASPAAGTEADSEEARRERRMAALASILGGPPGWLLEVRPAGGTLHAALARARWGNAAVSFGILLLLALAAVALALSARRAQETARRQLEFTASISHELRTPLAAIRSLAENLADGVVREDAQARRYGEEINRQGERLSEMVEQVLALSADAAGPRPRSLRPVDPATLVAEAVAESRAIVPDARVEVGLSQEEGELPPLVGDPTALRRALQNLVANALKHGGEPPWAAVRACVDRQEGTLRIGVTDRGPGIPAAERERIFEPFVRGQRAQEEQLPGAGLGLHLVRRTAASHGGRVEVCSAPGEGSTFTLVLPLRSPFGEAADGGREPASTSGHREERS